MGACAAGRSTKPPEPGMSANVTIGTGAPMAWDHLPAPILCSLGFALRES